jgi:hypothetical protein
MDNIPDAATIHPEKLERYLILACDSGVEKNRIW